MELATALESTLEVTLDVMLRGSDVVLSIELGLAAC